MRGVKSDGVCRFIRDNTVTAQPQHSPPSHLPTHLQSNGVCRFIASLGGEQQRLDQLPGARSPGVRICKVNHSYPELPRELTSVLFC